MAENMAAALKALHVPHAPIILANVWDVTSLSAVLSLNTSTQQPVKAVATASWAVAAALGIADEDLTWEQNFATIKTLSPIVARAGLPFSADLQDGYGDQVAHVIRQAVTAGVVGANIEDSIPSAGMHQGISGSLYPIDDQLARLKLVLETATEAGCPEFALNARCDMFCLEEHPELTPELRMNEALKRGKAYLELGATTVFYWGKFLGEAEIQVLVRELDGRVAVQANAVPGLDVKQLGDIGVARISVGPAIYRQVVQTIAEEARKLLA